MAYKQPVTLQQGPAAGKSPPPPKPASPPPPQKPPATKAEVTIARPPARLVSLDAYRGFIMTLLAAAGFGIHALSEVPADSPVWTVLSWDTWQRIAFHFEHPLQWRSNFLFGPSTDPTEGSPWLRGAACLWDLIQPSFMFMVGVAMPFSANRRRSFGATNWQRWRHAIVRAIILILLGVFLYSQGRSRTTWIFPNVLAQIGLGYLFAFAVLNLRWFWQVAAIVVILAGTWIGFQTYHVPEDHNFAELEASPAYGEILDPPFRQWSKNGNIAHDFDVWFLNQFPRPQDREGNPERFNYNPGGYQTLNFVPSIATMILGVICGQILLSITITPWRKVGLLLLIAVVCYGLGMAMGIWAMPIVKRLWTPSWMLFSGGYVVTILATFYILFDILPFKKLAFPLVVVGVNSLLFYLIGELPIGEWVRENVVHIHLRRPLEWLMGGIAKLTNSGASLVVEGKTLGESIYLAFQPVIDPTAVFLVFWTVGLIFYRKRLILRV